MSLDNLDGQITPIDLLDLGLVTRDSNGRLTNGGSNAVWLRPSAKIPTRPQPTMLTTFQSGHGWTSVGAGSTFNLNDTTTYLFGSQGITVTTPGNGVSAAIQNLALASTDFSASTTVIWLKVDDITHLKEIDVYWGDTSLANNFFSLFMDGTLAAGPFIRSGEWVGVRIPRENVTTTGAPNWAAITNMKIRVIDDNTGNPVTIHYGGVGRIADPTAFANGVVSVTFDDGYVSQYTEGRKKLDQYGYAATIYNIISFVDDGTGLHLTSAQLTELQDKHGWEIAAHAYTQADHDANFTTLTSAQVDADAWQMKKWLIDNGYKGHNHFAYPGGAWNLTTEAALQKYFQTVRLLNNTPRMALPPVTSPVTRVQCFEVLNTTTTAAIQALVDAAYTNKTWLVLCFHKIVTSPSVSTEYSIANFGTVVDYLNTKGIPVRTIGDVLASL